LDPSLLGPTAVLTDAATPSQHDRLLHEAVRRLAILRQVMRLTVQELRNEPQPAEAIRKSANGFGDTHFHILHLLSEFPSLPVGEIAERCRVAAPTISKMLNPLEAEGVIERQIDPTNRRVIRVKLTEAGRAAEAAMARRFEAALARVLSPLADGELGELISAFGHLERLVGEKADPASAPAPHKNGHAGGTSATRHATEVSSDGSR
jgi:DNA-binding MarR family transcriptional regulator